jgi:hypothetical protein
LIDTEHAGGIRHRGHDPHCCDVGPIVFDRVMRCRRLGRCGVVLERPARRRPGVRERTFDVGDRRTAHLDAGVAPGIQMPRWIADPHLADAQSGHERNRAIHGDHLAMVATDPAERAVEARGVVAADLDATGAQALPERPRRLPEPAHPVVEQPDANALSRLLDQGVGEQPALIVLVNDVHLEVNRVPRGTDRVEPGGIVLCGVFQEPHAVAFAQPRPRRAREHLVGDLPKTGRVATIASSWVLRCRLHIPVISETAGECKTPSVGHAHPQGTSPGWRSHPDDAP